MGKEVDRSVSKKRYKSPQKDLHHPSLAGEELLIKPPTTEREMTDVELKSWTLGGPIPRHKLHS